jgi:hypothetical protein
MCGVSDRLAASGAGGPSDRTFMVPIQRRHAALRAMKTADEHKPVCRTLLHWAGIYSTVRFRSGEMIFRRSISFAVFACAR